MRSLAPVARVLTLLAVPALCVLPAGQEPRLRADAPAAKPADNPAEKAAASLYEDVRQETLPNGLRVFLKPIPSSPVVTTMVAYKVGSADEDLDNTGLSHYLEHLMFKGTDKIMPGDIDRVTLRNGGANNANTSEDCTIYFFNFAADRWEAALDIEADRMRNIRIDAKHEFEQEKGAVISELERNEDEPWDLESKAILPALFGKVGPYGHPVIGEREHVRGATANVIKAHYDKWYYPNNAVLVVCGGFDPDRAMGKVKKLFGPIARGELPERKPEKDAKREGPVHKDIPSKFQVPRMLMGFNTFRTGDPDFPAFEVLQSILTGGKTSRLYKKMVEGEEIAATVGSFNSTGRYPGWFSVQVELLPGKSRKQAEDLVLAELKKLQDEPVSPTELNRVKRQVLRAAIFNREDVQNLADSIARGVVVKDFDYVKNYLPRVAAVTAEEVQAAARKYLAPDQRVVVWSVPPEKRGEGGAGGRREESAKPKGDNRQPTSPRGRHAARAEPSGAAAGFSLTDAKRVVLDNGLTLLLFENHRLPTVVASAFVRNVRVTEPEDKAGVAALTGRMLDEGTRQHTGPEIAEMIENAGGLMDMNENGGGVEVLAPDRGLGLKLLFECLTQPSFPRDAFARERARLLAEIDDQQRQPEVKAQLVYRALVYGKHPLGRPSLGRHATVEKLTPADCANFHHLLFAPNNTLLAVVGDFNPNQVVDEVKRLTADWKSADVHRPELPAIPKIEKFTEKIVTIPQAAQLHFLMGHPGIRRKSEDYYRLLVMDYVLGTGPGFTDRLSSRLRDREGLAYTVSATVTTSATEEPGLFTCYIGTPPQNFARVRDEFREELNRIRDETSRREEVEDAKLYLLGKLPFELTTNARIASHLLLSERYGLGLGYLEDYRKSVAAVTPEDIQSVARKYLDPEHMAVVAVGAIDAKGKVLKAEPLPERR